MWHQMNDIIFRMLELYLLYLLIILNLQFYHSYSSGSFIRNVTSEVFNGF